MNLFHPYGFIIGIAVLAGVYAVEKKAGKKYADELTSGALWVFFCAIIGARLYHVITDFKLYRGANLLEIVAVWNGGLGIFGAILGGVAGLLISLYRRKKFNIFELFKRLDFFAVGLPLGQAIGRWGNYVNRELYGVPTSLPWKIFIPPESRLPRYANEQYFHPLFLYESIALFCLWIVVWKWSAISKTENTKRILIGSGRVFGLYLVGYGIIRFSLEFLRARNSTELVTSGQISSLVSVVVGISLLSRRTLQVREKTEYIPYNTR